MRVQHWATALQAIPPIGDHSWWHLTQVPIYLVCFDSCSSSSNLNNLINLNKFNNLINLINKFNYSINQFNKLT